MMTLAALAAHIAIPTGLTIGTDFFPGQRPSDAPDACVTLLERTGGRQDDQTRVQEWPIQVLTRAFAYHGTGGARELCWRVYDVIVNQQGVVVDGYVYSAIGISPASIGRDERDRNQFSANLVLRIKAAPVAEED